MCLHEDGVSDPEGALLSVGCFISGGLNLHNIAGIKVRPVKGKDAVTYLDPGALTAPLSYVTFLLT